MKIGIVTHYNVHNHGAQLQLYALCSFFRDLGHEASALTYTKNYDFLGRKLAAKYSISLQSIPIYLRYIKEKGINRTLYNLRKRRLLNAFRSAYRLEGEYYCECKDLDLLVIGSDEIFSIESGLNPWFWGMGVPCDSVISYGASFGPTTIDFIEQHKAVEFVRAGIERIGRISVRDDSSMQIIKRLSGKQAQKVCDPVLLYGFQRERMAAERVEERQYVLIYSYDDNMNDPTTVSRITEYAGRYGYKTISVGYYHEWCERNINVSPLDVCPWFERSAMVFTDTYHGSVLSLLTHAQFCVIVRNNAYKLVDLLKQYDLVDRIIDAGFDCFGSILDRPIDYDAVERMIGKTRDESAAFLLNAVSDKEVQGD